MRKKQVRRLCALGAAAGIGVLFLLPTSPFEYPRLDSIVDGGIAMIVLTLSVLSTMDRRATESGFHGLTVAFLVAALLRFLSSATENDQPTIWLHRLCSLSLAAAFVLQLSPLKTMASRRVTSLVQAPALLLGIVVFFVPTALPPAVVAHRFSPSIVVLSQLAAFGYFFAAFYCTRHRPLFASALLLGASALLIPFLSLWSLSWWVLLFVELGVFAFLASALFLKQRKETMRAYESMAELACLMDMAADAIVVRDASDHISYWSEGAEKTYGYNRQEAFGRAPHHLLKTRFSEPLPEILQKLSSDGRWEGEVIHTTRDGRSINVRSRWAALWRPDGSRRAILELNTDVTNVFPQ